MSQVLQSKPGIHVFWSEYDPLDLASNSIDPLGFMAGYIALADRILPGFTTITTTPRYASMLCLALKLARDTLGEGVGQSATSHRRQIIEKLKTFERAWGLACGLAEEDPAIGEKAISGLRGIRAVHRWRNLHAGKEKVSLTFALLSNQVRYGGIGAYSTFLESLHMADMTTLTLRPLGQQLAEAFPSPLAYGLDVLREDAKLPVDRLAAWGQEAHAGTLRSSEAKLIRRALQGGEEVEFDDVTRWTMLRLVCKCNSDSSLDEERLLNACLAAIRGSPPNLLEPSGRAQSRIQVALEVIGPYERLYQTLGFIFDRLRLRANVSGQADARQVMAEPAVLAACAELRTSAQALLNRVEAGTTEETGLGNVRPTLAKLGLLDLARSLTSLANPLDLAHEILQRHRRVQEGKFDGGAPKGPWIRLASGSPCVVELTSQRFGIDASEGKDNWRLASRHPYRTFAAKRFIDLCKIQ